MFYAATCIFNAILNTAGHHCRRLPQNLVKAENVVKPQPLIKAQAF
jgi:hypothetical protein